MAGSGEADDLLSYFKSLPSIPSKKRENLSHCEVNINTKSLIDIEIEVFALLFGES